MSRSPLKPPSSADLRVAIAALQTLHDSMEAQDAARRVADWLEQRAKPKTRPTYTPRLTPRSLVLSSGRTFTVGQQVRLNPMALVKRPLYRRNSTGTVTGFGCDLSTLHVTLTGHSTVSRWSELDWEFVPDAAPKS